MGLHPGAVLRQRGLEGLLLSQIGGLRVLELLSVRNVLLKFCELLLVGNLGGSLGVEGFLQSSARLLDLVLGIFLHHLEDCDDASSLLSTLVATAEVSLWCLVLIDRVLRVLLLDLSKLEGNLVVLVVLRQCD